MWLLGLVPLHEISKRFSTDLRDGWANLPALLSGNGRSLCFHRRKSLRCRFQEGQSTVGSSCAGGYLASFCPPFAGLAEFAMMREFPFFDEFSQQGLKLQEPLRPSYGDHSPSKMNTWPKNS